MHPMAFRKYWIDNILGICAKALIVIGVKGDSMEGEINNGDIILINKEDNALLNGIYVIRIEGDLIVKRIQRLPGGIIKVISANSAYESFEIDTNNPPLDFEAIGRVVWHGRNVH
ncbi:helix-turn-helix transcriptional regulator [Ignatzschineria indica]|uniref:S24 family peptidase n=1 Tax=Ignatzschineria indica TaxID=472583 RepID=UPI0025754541|nr:S24 family peptidase [Ignatzschineria indica]MDM1546154.1 helix-turn-helix transcriptional regulator [Ignatzschineria indica]